MHLEKNLKLLMQQAGINPSQQSSSIDGDQKGDNMEEQVGMGYVEYDLTASQFDNVLKASAAQQEKAS